jgi:hypothetical protein
MNTRFVLIISISVLLFGFLFWPTLYRYDTMKLGDNSVPLRVNRFTGSAQYASAGKWISLQDQATEGKESLIPSSEQSKIVNDITWMDVTGSPNSLHNTLSIEGYNGSSWRITKLRFRVVSKNKNGSSVLNRLFATETNIMPFSPFALELKVGQYASSDSVDSSLDEARGCATDW